VVAASPVTQSVQVIDLEQWVQMMEHARSVPSPLVIRGAFFSLAKSWPLQRFLDYWTDKPVGVTVNLPDHGVPYREYAKSHLKRGTLGQVISLHLSEFCWMTCGG
jgi:hypothetical protein